MPNLANITIKKNDGTTDVVYTGIVPSSGDKNPAIWRNDAIGIAPAHRPTLTLMTSSNGTKTARRAEGQFVFPVTSTGTDGRITVTDKVIVSINCVVPQGIADVNINEGVAQGLNLFASALMKSSVQSGYAPT